MRLVLVILLLWPAGLSISCATPTCGPDLFLVEGSCTNVVPDCGGTCKVNEICDATKEPFACKCAPGYDGRSCEWVGVVNDPLFERRTDGNGELYWRDERFKGATLLPDTDGPNGGGEGLLLPSVVCEAGALSQSVQMPPYEAAGALVAEVTYAAEDVDGFAVGFGNAWTHLPDTAGSWRTARFCLGESAYGRLPGGSPVEIRLAASEESRFCFADPQRGSIRIDHFAISPPLPEDTCVEPGSVLNGDANSKDGGWKLVPEDHDDAELVPGAGPDGSDGVRLRRPAGSTAARAATTNLSVPALDPASPPALRFWWRGSSDRLFWVGLGPPNPQGEPWRALGQLAGNNAEHYSTYCLPPWTHGTVVDLTFSMVDEGAVDETVLLVDEIEILGDETCGASTDLLDPGFESAPHLWPGTYPGVVRQQAMIMQVDEERARSGRGVFELTYWHTDAEMKMETFVLVPEADGASGPQLVFYSNVPAMPETELGWVVANRESEGERLTNGGDWLVNEACLPRSWAGRWVRFQVRVGPTSGGRGTIAPKRVFLDDFSLTTSPDCPDTTP